MDYLQFFLILLIHHNTSQVVSAFAVQAMYWGDKVELLFDFE